MSNIFAAIDIGTNSIRLAVVRIEEDHRLSTLAVHREVVRLGQDEFETGQMTPSAIARGALVCVKFAEVARGFGASEIVAFATSAVREADNRDEFIDRVRVEARIEVRVISGVEEARLIWLGVSSGIELGDKRALLIDIGGGSTEVVVWDAEGSHILESMKLGAIRLSNMFFNREGAFTDSEFERVQHYVMGVAAQVIRRARDKGFDLALGSAGTITTLGEIVTRRFHDPTQAASRTLSFTVEQLRETVKMLYSIPLEERRRVPGMDPNRADIIVGGAAIILTLMESLGATSMTVSERGLRDGILRDHQLRNTDAADDFQQVSVRRRSILQLAHAFHYEADHAQHCVELAVKLFDELKRLDVHDFTDTDRELLEYAAITHDIGMFLSHSNHQKHAYYLIRNSDLLGFTDNEIDVIANVAMYHRKGIPKKKHLNLENLSRGDRYKVTVLAAMLRVTEGMDRGHLGLVKDVRLEKSSPEGAFILTLLSDKDCQLEVWGVQNNKDLWEYVFEAELIVKSELVTQ